MATELYTHATHVPFMAKYVFDLPKINRSKKRQINTVTVIAGRTISSKEKIKKKKNRIDIVYEILRFFCAR